MPVFEGAFSNGYLAEFFSGAGGGELLVAIGLTLGAIFLFKILVAVAEAMVSAVAATARVAAQLVPFLLLLLLLMMWAFGV